MTNYRAILEYHYKGNTTTQVARICECSRTTVLKTIKRAKECGLELSLFDKTSDYDLLKKLYPKRVRKEEYAAPNFYELEKDKKKRKLMYHSITQHPVSSNHKLGDWFAKHGTQDLLELNQNMDIASVIQIFISLRQQQQKLYDQVMFSVCFPCWTIAMEPPSH